MAKSINISLPSEVLIKLDNEAKNMGVNRSAYISMSLNRMWQNDEVIKNMPEIVRSLNAISEKIKGVNENDQ